ncbi:substrate-binding domain-containing protein [Devosia sp.]|uniref:LacI family DNA-binding transcriptional regulator n=1 Tax=Devosia sp. TaxID=1871048 RepID=UPI0019F589CB|nr:substrate-binding domain-containing protein [Devosia sp.]MBE0578572.1 substrate-binding domain-containing protein [Devosia sp.]
MGDNRAKTLRELAARLDLSITTVSRALAGHEQIALKTRQRVSHAARELGYVPNRAARQLVSGRSGFVGLLMPIRGPNFVDSYLGEFITGLGEGLVSHGLDLFLATVQQGQNELEVLRHVVESGRADGMVVPRIAEQDPRLAYLAMQRFPSVSHGRLREPANPHNWLDSDGEAAFGEAFDLLYDHGHRHIGLVTISDRMTFRHYREAGLESAIVRKGDPSVRLSVESFPRFDRLESVAAINRLLHRPDRPTAIIGLFDEIAIAILEQAAKAGINVPQDLSVIGFDNITAGAYAPPGLTTFDAKIRASARDLAHMLVKVIENPADQPATRLVRPDLVLRASHGPAPRRPKVNE